MSDDNITEFKSPNVVVHNFSDNPEFYNALLNESLDSWKGAFENLRDKGFLKNDLQALSGLISCYIQYMVMGVGKEQTIDLLEEHLRRLKTSKDGDIM